MKIDIRPAKIQDLPMIVHYQVAMAQETEGMALKPEVVKQGAQAVFDDPRKGFYWVATTKLGNPTTEDKVVGCVLLCPEWSDWRNGTVYWIHSLFVEPNYRGKGIFRAFYERIKENVERSSELKGIRLYVDKRNKNACQSYSKVGMDDGHYSLFEWMKEH